MFADKETIITNILVVMFLVAVCTIIFGATIVRDAVVVGFGIVMLLLFFCFLYKGNRYLLR